MTPDKFIATTFDGAFMVRTEGLAILGYTDKAAAVAIAVELNAATYEQQQEIILREWNR